MLRTTLLKLFWPCDSSIWFTHWVIWILLPLGNTCAQEESSPPPFETAKPPGWVKQMSWYPPQNPATNNGASTEFLLLDRQDAPSQQSSYQRYVIKMLTEAGVQDNGTIQISFRPDFQTLTIHSIDIHRDGQVINQLQKEEVKILNQEDDLHLDLFYGSSSATIFIKDLRVGDILDYAYTITGFNPAIGDHYANLETVQWSVPVRSQHFRILWEHKNRPLHFQLIKTTQQPVISEKGSGQEYVWHFKDIAPVYLEDATPPDFVPLATIQISDFNSWSEVVDWALPLYPEMAPDNESSFTQLTEKWISELEHEEDRIIAAIEFVQDQIRYLGIELGPDSIRPNKPADVLRERFGDCKDKSYLLASLLKKMGYKAWPTLVSSAFRSGVSTQLPSPFVFDHAIVCLEFNNDTFWIDPTRSNQRGFLDLRYISHFGYGLKVKDGEAGLTKIVSPHSAQFAKTVRDTYIISSYDQPVAFVSESIFNGLAAENFRYTITSTPVEDLQKDYLNYYAEYWPGITISRPFEISDEKDANQIKVVEHYLIKNFWKTSPENGHRYVEFYPDSLYNLFTIPETRIRSMPIGLTHPVEVDHHTKVILPEPWQVDEDQHTVESDFIQFSTSRKSEKKEKEITFNYHYKTLTNIVAAADAKAYFEDIDQVEDLVGDQLYFGPDLENFLLSDLNWYMITASSIHALFVFVLLIYLYRRHPRLEVQPTSDNSPPELTGLTGWLIIVGIHVVMTPVGYVINFGEIAPVWFSSSIWKSMATPGGEEYIPFMGGMLIGEAIGNITFILFSILNMVWFFKCHRFFPRCYIIYMTSNLLFLATDHFVAGALTGETWDEDLEGIGEIFGSAFSCMIWSLYMLKSRRVKNTFNH